MLKSMLSPLQKWLLKRGQCVACGMPLEKGSVRAHKRGEITTCKCGRSYFHLKDGTWQRAKQSEI